MGTQCLKGLSTGTGGTVAMCDDRRMHPPEKLPEFDQVRLSIRGLDVRVFESDVVVGPAFVLIHGLGVSSRYFGPLAKELSQHGRVLVLDLPGFGKTRDPDHALRISGFAHVVNETIRELSVVTPVLIGHSMGSQVAVEAMVQSPGLFHGAVLAAPVINDRERRAGLVLWRFAQSSVKETPAAAWASVSASLRSGPGWLLRDFAPMMQYRIEDQLKKVDVPLTLVAGTGDRVSPPEWCHRLASRRSDVNVVVIEGAAHDMIHTHAADVARAALDITGPRRDHGQPRPSPGLPPCGD